MTEFLNVINAGLLFSLALVIYRLLRGPTLADRAVASEQIAIRVVALIVIASINFEQPVLLDLIMVTAVVGFLSAAVIGIFLERDAKGKTRAQLRE